MIIVFAERTDRKLKTMEFFFEEKKKILLLVERKKKIHIYFHLIKNGSLRSN